MGATLAVWIHNLDPFIFEINGIGPRWYGLAYIIGLVAGWYLVKRWAEQERVPIKPVAVQDLAVYFGLGMILGGRIGYAIFYDPRLFGFTDSFPFWSLLAVWEGGMASHGGIVGMFLGVLTYCLRHRIPFWVIADAAAVVTPIGICAGRIANFINGELWGRPTDVAWGMKFPSSLHADYQWRENQALADAGNPEVGSAAWYDITEPLRQLHQTASEQLHHATAGSDEWRALIMEHVLTRHPSQLYAAIMEGIAVLTVGMLVHRCHRRPGLSLGVVLVTYAIMRFINEYWREPDPGYALYFGWMSKGQMLSIPILLIGAGFVVWAWQRGPKEELYTLQTTN